MKRHMAIAALLLLATAAPLAASAQEGLPALGGGRGDQDEARAAVRAGRQIPLARVIQAIAARNPGRMLNATVGDQGGRPAYFVQWQKPDGRVVVFIVDAESGAMIGRQGG